MHAKLRPALRGASPDSGPPGWESAWKLIWGVSEDDRDESVCLITGGKKIANTARAKWQNKEYQVEEVGSGRDGEGEENIELDRSENNKNQGSNKLFRIMYMMWLNIC